MNRINQVTQESYNIGKEEGWGEFECTHGYGVFDGEYPTEFGYIEAEHIEMIDCMSSWNSDNEAAEHAEKHEGFKIIHDIEGIEPVFIDTPENREKIMKMKEEE